MMNVDNVKSQMRKGMLNIASCYCYIKSLLMLRTLSKSLKKPVLL